jgi:hypothetical protein
MRPTDNAVNVARCGMSGVRHQVGIASGHFKAAVPQQLGNNGLTIAIFCQKAGKGVAKAVEHKSVSGSTGSFIQPHFLHNLIKDLADIVHDALPDWGTEAFPKEFAPIPAIPALLPAAYGEAAFPFFAI